MGHHLTLRSWFKSYFSNFIIIITGNYTHQVGMPRGYQKDGFNLQITHCLLCKQPETWQGEAGSCLPRQEQRALNRAADGSAAFPRECDPLIKSPFPPLLCSDREDFNKREAKAALAFSGLDFFGCQ